MEWLLVLRMKGNKELKWICWNEVSRPKKRGIHVFLQVFSKCQWWFGENDTGAEGNLLLWSLLQQTMEAGYLVPWCLPHTILREHTLVILIGKGRYSTLPINFANQPLQRDGIMLFPLFRNFPFCSKRFTRNRVPSNPYCSFGFGMHYNMKKHKRTEGRKKESAIRLSILKFVWQYPSTFVCLSRSIIHHTSSCHRPFWPEARIFRTRD